jgi:hypothetical protein
VPLLLNKATLGLYVSKKLRLANLERTDAVAFERGFADLWGRRGDVFAQDCDFEKGLAVVFAFDFQTCATVAFKFAFETVFAIELH